MAGASTVVGGMLHYLSKGESIAVEDSEGLRAAVAMGEVGAKTLVWYEGLPEWMPLSRIPTLAFVLEVAVNGNSSPPLVEESSSKPLAGKVPANSERLPTEEDTKVQACSTTCLKHDERQPDDLAVPSAAPLPSAL